MQDNTPDSQPTNDTPQTGPDPDATPLSTPAPGAPQTYPSPSVSPDSTSVPVEQEVTQPSEAPAAVAANPIVDTPQQPSKRKKWLVPVIIAAVAVVLLGVSVAAYNLWYQNPDKVLSDAMVNAVRAKTVSYTGSLTVNDTSSTSRSSMQTFKLNVEGKNNATAAEVNVKLAFTADEKDYNLSGAGSYDKDGNLYFKINDVRKLIDSLGSSTESLPKSVDDIITKVDSKWIKISVNDLKEFSPEYSKTQTCTKDAMKKFENDKAATNEIVELYKKNKFIVVKEKLGSKDGSLGYVIDGDKVKAKSFVKELNNTTIVKELKKCDDSFKLDENDLFKDSDSDDGESRVEVWVDRWSHQLTKLHLTGKSDDSNGEATIEPTFNQPVTVTAPTSFVTLSELKADIEKAQQELMMSALGSDEATYREAIELESRTNSAGEL